jgi:precorrin-6B methylase 2
MELPKNIAESWHHARDIMHADKAEHNMHISKVISCQLDLLKKPHCILESVNLDKKLKSEFLEIKSEYEKMVSHRGAIILDIIQIERKKKTHSLFEDADFSESKIKSLILQGE